MIVMMDLSWLRREVRDKKEEEEVRRTGRQS